MSLNYPLTAPTSPAPRRVSFAAVSTAGMQQSPFSGEQTVYVHQGEWLEAMVELPPMLRPEAEAWISGLLLALNGREGTFLLGDPVGATPRGSWSAGSPYMHVRAAHAAGVKTVSLGGLLSGATGKAGDYIQFGSGATTSLHKVVQDFTAPASGNVDVEIWPRTKAALTAGQVPVVEDTVGLWRLKENRREWSVEEAQVFGVSFSALQAF